MSKFSPPAAEAISRLAAHQEILVEILSPCVQLAPNEKSSKRISDAVDQHRLLARELTAEVRNLGADSADLMESNEAELAEFAAAIAGVDYYERLISAYIGFGIISDFFAELAPAYAKPQANAIRNSLGSKDFWDWLATDVLAQLRTDPRLSARLALWARSIVADGLLEVWRTLDGSAGSVRSLPKRRNATQFRELEPLITALVANHSERMSKLELTA